MSQDRELSLIDCESPLQGKLARRVRRGINLLEKKPSELILSFRV